MQDIQKVYQNVKPIFRQNWHSAVGRVKFEAWGLCILIPVGELLALGLHKRRLPAAQMPNASWQRLDLPNWFPDVKVEQISTQLHGGGWKVYQ